MSAAAALLELANKILTGQTIVKAEDAEDPDKLPAKKPDERAEEAAPGKEDIQAAREEASAGQQAAAPEGGVPANGEGGPGAQEEAAAAKQGEEPAPEEEEEGVTKAELLDSMKFLASAHGLSNEEIVKAFTGCEGDPAVSPAPLGKGVEMLEQIVMGMNAQSKILESIASAILELTKNQVKLNTEVTKSLEASEVAKSEAAEVKAKVEALPRTAPALPAKAEIAKSEGAPAAGAGLTADDLFKIALEGKMSPMEVAAANRRVNYGPK